MKLKLSQIALSFALMGLASQAKDMSKLNVLGFSKDGKYLAFETFRVQDGSGIAISKISFLNVDKNEYVASAVEVREREEAAVGDLSKVRSEAQAKALPLMKKLGIDTNEKGDVRIYRLVSDLSLELPSSVRFSLGDFAYPPIYQLDLVESPLGNDFDDKVCYGMAVPALLHVKVGEVNQPTQQVDTFFDLQKDARLPRSRECAHDYSVHQVLVFNRYYSDAQGHYNVENKLVAFLYYRTPGFEGSNYEIMAVSGQIPQEK